MEDDAPRTIYITTLGQWRQRALLRAAGYEPRFGWPKSGSLIAAWGQGRYAKRAQRLAKLCGGHVVVFEDAPLRGLFPKDAFAVGVIADDLGVHFDASRPSRVERILTSDAIEQPELRTRATAALQSVIDQKITKYAAFDPTQPAPDAGYVLVVDQVRGDASAPDPTRFEAMLCAARAWYPDHRILIKSHPETKNGQRRGHFTAQDGELLDDDLSPWSLLKRAHAVFTVSSQLGLEAIFAGHKPHVFGTPIYAGWGLTSDHGPPLPHRTTKLTPLDLFTGLYIIAPSWIDPATGGRATLEDTIALLAALRRGWLEDRNGWVILGASRWKRGWMRRHFGQFAQVHFSADVSSKIPRMAWGQRAKAPVTVEDGFIRSRGLGAKLVPPQSLCLDDLGIHYDADTPSRLEQLIAASPTLPQDALDRAACLRQRLVTQGHNKYGLGGSRPVLPEGQKILVLGQVADDASVRCGAPGLNDYHTLKSARMAHPQAALLYKPHPDVSAGLRPGCPEALPLADQVLKTAESNWLLKQVDEVWTLTSLGGFEALVHGTPVTCLGRPFYAGWGLTRDLGPSCPRRRSGITLDGLIHAALIDYPRYWDPVTGKSCPVEVLLSRLENDQIPTSKFVWLRTTCQTIWKKVKTFDTS